MLTEKDRKSKRSHEAGKLFHEDAYQIMVVNDKFKNGYDEPKIAGIAELKFTHGAATVQMDGRGNRICLPYDKKLTIINYVSSPEQVKADYAPYYNAATVVFNNDNALDEVKKAYSAIEKSGIIIEPESRNYVAYCEQMKKAKREHDETTEGYAYMQARNIV